MECVIDFKVLHGEQNEEIVKEVSVAAENVTETFHFKSPYPMSAHGSQQSCLFSGSGQIQQNSESICAIFLKPLS
jgi:hypothetical protein